MNYEELIKKGHESLQKEIELAKTITHHELNGNAREADGLKEKYRELYNKTNDKINEYFSDISSLDRSLLKDNIPREYLDFTVLLLDCIQFLRINRHYRINSPEQYEDIRRYTPDYISFAKDYNMNNELMKLLRWYFQKGLARGNDIKHFASFVYEQGEGILAYRNYLVGNKLQLPIKTDKLSYLDSINLLENIKDSLKIAITSIILDIVNTYYSQLFWEQKFSFINNYLLYLTLYTANIINMLKEYQYNIDYDKFLEECINVSKQTIDNIPNIPPLKVLDENVKKGIKISEEYRERKNKTK